MQWRAGKDGLNNDRGHGVMSRYEKLSADSIRGKTMLSTVVCGNYFAEPDTILVFEVYLGVLGDGTRLAMPKTICAPDSSSLKPGSGATEGVLD